MGASAHRWLWRKQNSLHRLGSTPASRPRSLTAACSLRQHCWALWLPSGPVRAGERWALSSRSFRAVYGLSAGGAEIRSVTRCMASWESALTACANLSLSVMMPETSKLSSALSNQMVGLGAKEYILVRERTAPPCVFQTFAYPTSPPPALSDSQV